MPPPSTTGTLYLVATPIGNLQDLAPRARDTLQAADLIVAEDTRHTRGLLTHLGLQKPLESFHGDSDERKLARLVKALLGGQTLALVTDGGVPGVSDPGRELVEAAVAHDIPVVPIPGPSALITALCGSGLPGNRFVFAGFPPRKSGEREAFLRRWLTCGETVILYEAPHRIVATLTTICDLYPERPVVAGRELTKQYEEFVRGTAAEVLEIFTEREPRGEFALVVGPSGPPATQTEIPPALPEVIARLRQAGLSVRDTADLLAQLDLGGRRDLYQLVLQVDSEADSV